MRSAILGFVAGAGLLQLQAELPSVNHLVLLAVLGLSLVCLAWNSRRPAIRISLLLISGAALGFFWSATLAGIRLSNELVKDLEGRDITVIGTISSLPAFFEQGARFQFDVERVVQPEGERISVPPRLALSWYFSFRGQTGQPGPKVQAGERWQLTVRLRRPHGNANPHGFDYEAWLLEQNVRATGYVRHERDAANANRRLDEFVFSPGHLVGRMRGSLRDRIYDALPDSRYAGIVVALVIGDQKAISQSDWDVFSRTGVSHLMSISGLHITMIAGLFAAIVSWLWRRSFFLPLQLPLMLPAQKAAAVAGASVALVYVALAGFGVPAQRTLYMLAVVAVALWHGRITSVSHVLCIALGVVAVIDPWAVLWPGFWLSFCAVGIILYGTAGRMETGRESPPGAGRLRLLRSAVRTQYLVTLGLLPLTVLLFGQISLIGPIANAVAIPVVSFLVTPMALIGSIAPAPLSRWMLEAAHLLIEMLAFGLEWLSTLPAAVWSAPVPSWWIFLPALLGTLWLLAPRGWPMRWLGAAGLVPLLLNVPSHPEPGELWLTAFDVGQGTSLLVETSAHRLLYDTGPAYSPEADGGNRVILPYLRARGINSLDAVVVSHSDVDHAGGALSILRHLPIRLLSSSLPDEHPIVRAASDHRPCMAGQAWEWDGVHFEMLHPAPSSYERAAIKPNASSCTLRITVRNRSILLPGDIEAAQERMLVREIPEKLQASILVAPHHGSGTSSTQGFLEAVKPDIALFQVGYRNRYQHPKREVFDRYGSLGIRRVRSDESGAVMLRFGASVDVAEYRREHPRYWHGR